MSGLIEAIHIYDERNTAILSHTYAARPMSAARLLPLYLEHPAPRPNLIHLPHTSPPTLVYSLPNVSGGMLFLATSSDDIEPLLVLEFLHRVVDAFEDFLGAPLLPARIEQGYDVAAQLLSEMCDAGLVSTTEPNALREVVEVEGWVGKLLGGLNLPGKPTPTNPHLSSLASLNSPALPWRRANVRHTSNEMYADVVETLSVTLAPSGRPLAAFANGTIAFTSKISGVPDILLSLTSSGGRRGVAGMINLPVFHPCVRLARWKESPGELSFIPPDGRCVLAGYEVDLMPSSSFASSLSDIKSSSSPLKLPVSLEIRTSLGPSGSEFDVRVQVTRLPGTTSKGGSASLSSASSQFGGIAGSLGSGIASGLGGGVGGGGPLGNPNNGTPASPSLEDLVVSIPLPAEVRNLPEIRPSRGDATYNPGDKVLEWHIPTKAFATSASMTTSFSLRCMVVGTPTASADSFPEDDELNSSPDPGGFGFGYDTPYQGSASSSGNTANRSKQNGHKAGLVADSVSGDDSDKARDAKVAQNKVLMPASASVSFSVRGWLPSGLRVDSITIDTRKSKGLSEGVRPYKGVKYLTVSKGGVEIRC